MIRVLHYIGGVGLGGSQTLVMELFRRIDRAKVQFDFVVFQDQNNDDGYKLEIQELGGKIYACPRYNAKNHFVFCKWWDVFFENNPGYAILHGHVYSCASVYLPIAKKYGLITICHAHSTSNGGNRIMECAKKIYEYPLRYIPDYLFACSSDAGKWLYGERATHKSNYYLLPNCINVEKFSLNSTNLRKREAIQKKYGIASNTFVVGHVGSFRVAKNHEFILSIFEAFHKRYVNSVLLLVGIGERQSIILELCQKKGLADCVIFAGNQHDIVAYYSAMDCFLFPSLWEGLPVSVVEAQAAGLHCLISDTITKDVLLTDLVKQKSIDNNADDWAKELIPYTDIPRRGINPEEAQGLMRFDSKIVAQNLQDFYLHVADKK